MTTKREAALAVQAAKARLGVTWAELAEGVGAPLVWTTAPLVWTTAALLGHTDECRAGPSGRVDARA
jgi:cyanate lyase